MASVFDLSTTAASNGAIGSIDVAEDCDPANINNAIRLDRSLLAELLHAQTGEKVTAGSATVQTLTTGLGWSGLEQAMIAFEVGAGLTNTGALTLNVDTLGAANVKVVSNSGQIDPWPKALVAGGIYLAAYDGTNWVVLNPSPGAQDINVTFRGTVSNGDITIIGKSSRKRKITATATKAGGGTATFTFKIDGVALGGTANSVSASEQSQAHSSANTLDVGETLSVTVSSASSCTDVWVSIEYEDA